MHRFLRQLIKFNAISVYLSLVYSYKFLSSLLRLPLIISYSILLCPQAPQAGDDSGGVTLCAGRLAGAECKSRRSSKVARSWRGLCRTMDCGGRMIMNTTRACHIYYDNWKSFVGGARWTLGQCARCAIAEAKQRSQRSVIISSASVLRKARLAFGPVCICSRWYPLQF
jgi:hypothetical protein